MSTRPTLHWYPDRSPDGRKSDRWFVAAPEYPPCGGVWRELGRYRDEAWPAGAKEPVGAYCANREQAKRHLERWLRAHPRVPVLESKGWRASKRGPAPQPDWRIAQYLRLSGPPSGPPFHLLRPINHAESTGSTTAPEPISLEGSDSALDSGLLD